MWIYYEDKGKYLGLTKSKHNRLKNFIVNGLKDKEILLFKKQEVKLPNFEEKVVMDVMFDIPSFNHKYNLDCLNCDKVHANESCCGGSPFPLEIDSIQDYIFNGDLIPYVKDEFKTNLRLCMQEKTTDYIYNKNTKKLIPKENNKGIIECPLRGSDRCGLHAFILDKGLPYYTKPCTWMYPFDCAIELDKQLKPKSIFLFMLCERTSSISRWGETSYIRHCLDDNLNQTIIDSGYDEYYSQYVCDKTKYFKSKDYKEAYKLYDSEISYILGKETLKLFKKYFNK